MTSPYTIPSGTYLQGYTAFRPDVTPPEFKESNAAAKEFMRGWADAEKAADAMTDLETAHDSE